MSDTKHSLAIDFNHFFSPAISDGPQSFDEFQSLFEEAHPAISAFRSKSLYGYVNALQDAMALERTQNTIKVFADVENVVVFGIGGSALGTSSLHYALFGGVLSNQKRLLVVDHIEPQLLFDVQAATRGAKNLYVFISKSGNTSETLSQYSFAKKHFDDLSRDNLLFITDPKSGFFHDHVEKNEFHHLTIPSLVGGRFSVFTSVGLFPLGMAGCDIRKLLEGARYADQKCRSDNLKENPAALLATSLYYWLHKKKMSQLVVMPYSERLRLVSDWFSQLFAESLGKRLSLSGETVCTGWTPIKALGPTDQHSQLQLYLDGPRDKAFLFLNVEDMDKAELSNENFGDERIDFLAGKTLGNLLDAEQEATAVSLAQNDRPNATLKTQSIDEFHLGQLYQTLMNVIPYMGAFLNINPFDQPAVEQIKKSTFALMGRAGFEEQREKIENQEKRHDLIFS